MLAIFTPEFWSKVIGLIELIFGAACTIFFGHYLQIYASGGEELVIEASKTIEPVAQYYHLGYAFLIFVLAIMTLVSAMGFVMAIVLLKGAYKREYQKLTWWMIYCIGAVGVTFLILLSYGGHVWFVVLRSFVFLVIRGAMIWTVYVDLKDLEAEVTTEDKQGFTKDNPTDVHTTTI